MAEHNEPGLLQDVADASASSTTSLLSSLANLRILTARLESLTSSAQSLHTSLTKRTILLESLSAEHRILEAEKDLALQTLLRVQSDLDSVKDAEKAMVVERNRTEEELREIVEGEYKEALKEVNNVRRGHGMVGLEDKLEGAMDPERRAAEYLRLRLEQGQKVAEDTVSEKAKEEVVPESKAKVKEKVKAKPKLARKRRVDDETEEEDEDEQDEEDEEQEEEHDEAVYRPTLTRSGRQVSKRQRR
ncbi:hypothetical protein YB2330_000127 [Saitoella coloradoensis]